MTIRIPFLLRPRPSATTALAILSILASSLESATEAGILWQNRRLLGEEMRIHEFAHDGTGNVVAVGINGTTWTAPPSTPTVDLPSSDPVCHRPKIS